MWFLVALASGSFYTISGLISRHVLRKKTDAWAFSFFFSAVGAIVSIPFFLSNAKVAISIGPWLLMVLVGAMIVIHNWLNFSSTKYLEASVQGTIVKFRLVWAFLLGVIFLHESLTMYKAVGTILAVLAGWLVVTKFKRPGFSKGVFFAFASTFVYAAVILFYKFLFSSFSSQALTFFIFLIPAMINVIAMPDSIQRITTMLKEDGGMVVIACALGGLANQAMNYALSVGEISRVLVVIESFLVATLVGEHLFLKEREHLKEKLIAVASAIASAVLMRI